jgi:integrase
MHTINAFLSYQSLRGFSARTIARRRWTLRAVCIETGRDLDRLRSVDVEVFLARRPAAESRRALLGDLRAYYRWALPRGFAHHDPTVLFDAPRVPRRDPRPLTGTEIRLLLDGAPPRTRRAVALGAYAGLRAGEIGRITATDVRGGVVHVRGGKGGKDRTVPLHPALEVECRGCVGLLVGLAPDGVSALIRDRMRAVELDGHRCHDLRATFATEAVRVAPIPTVARWLGHANWSTTQRYVMVDPGDAEQVAAMFPMAA